MLTCLDWDLGCIKSTTKDMWNEEAGAVTWMMGRALVCFESTRLLYCREKKRTVEHWGKRCSLLNFHKIFIKF